jgi:hypothetical protein
LRIQVRRAEEANYRSDQSPKNAPIDAKLLLYGNIFKRWDIIAKKSLDDVLENGGIWHLWGHSWEIDRYDNWPLLRDVLQYAKDNGRKYGADFVTNGMLVGY